MLTALRKRTVRLSVPALFLTSGSAAPRGRATVPTALTFVPFPVGGRQSTPVRTSGERA